MNGWPEAVRRLIACNINRVPTMRVDVSDCPSPHSFQNKAARALWGVVNLLFFRPSPKPLHGWRRFMLRCFGAKVGKGAIVYSSTRIWAPWNLELGDYSCLSHDVDCYCVTKIRLGAHATVSQGSFLCTASHDIGDEHMRLIVAPITVESQAWVCARAFVHPGMTIGEGAVVGACAVVTQNVEPWTVVAGHPAKFVKNRVVAETH